MKMNKNIWNGFNKWAMIVNDQSRIENVWNNGLAVDLQASEERFGKIDITIHNRNNDSMWKDDGNFVWGDDFIFYTGYGTLEYTSDAMYKELSQISKKLAKVVKLILS